jgi:hypothetical protein
LAVTVAAGINIGTLSKNNIYSSSSSSSTNNTNTHKCSSNETSNQTKARLSPVVHFLFVQPDMRNLWLGVSAPRNEQLPRRFFGAQKHVADRCAGLSRHSQKKGVLAVEN